MEDLKYRIRRQLPGMRLLVPAGSDGGLVIAMHDCDHLEIEDALRTAFTGDWEARTVGEPVFPIGSDGRSLAENVYLPGESPGPRVRLSLVVREEGDGGYHDLVYRVAKLARQKRLVIEQDHTPESAPPRPRE